MNTKTENVEAPQPPWYKRTWWAITRRGPIGWVRSANYIVKAYRRDLTILANGVDESRANSESILAYVKKATKVHVDVPASAKDGTTVMVCGEYKGRDYVQVFKLRKSDINQVIHELEQLKKYATFQTIDAPHGLDATMKRMLK